MKTKLYRDLAGLLVATTVALATVAPKVAHANDEDAVDSHKRNTRVALKRVEYEQAALDSGPFMNRPRYQPAFIDTDRLPEQPTATTAYALFGVSGVAVAGAVVFGVLESSASADAEQLCAGSVCLGSARDALDREKRFALATDISAGVALVSAGAGIYYWFKTKRENKRWLSARRSIQPTAVPGGLGVSLAGSF